MSVSKRKKKERKKGRRRRDFNHQSKRIRNEIERPANRSRMAASLIEPIKSMQQAAVEAATALVNEGRSGDDERQRVTLAHCVQLGAALGNYTKCWSN